MEAIYIKTKKHQNEETEAKFELIKKEVSHFVYFDHNFLSFIFDSTCIRYCSKVF